MSAREPEHPWWRSAVVYQVYPRSFADADADGMGDIPGIVSRLDYLSDLGVDAIWVSPFYASPLHDGGYDVADYRAVDPRLGSMDDVRRLIDGAHARGIRVFMDIVPNHSSSDHEWFKAVLDSEPGSPEWARYLIREGKGADRSEPPNNWRSVFHGAGWSQLPGKDGKPSGWWYLHLFDSTQPDFDWRNEDVRAEFDAILRFWFDLGIDGFRIDVAHGLVKEPSLPDFDYESVEDAMALLGVHDLPHAPFWDQDEVHDIYRRWRAIADSYDPPRVFCGETWVPNAERLARYQRPDELHTSFNFDYLQAGWDGAKMRQSIDETVTSHAKVGAPPTWVLSNHDVVRHRTRFSPGFDDSERLTCVVDEARGLDRARAATLFMLALPGSAYVYQGEELGLVEVRDLAPEVRQDPAWFRSGGTDGTRDGCRVPIPWSGDAPSYGFNTGSASWLPQPAVWAELAQAKQESTPGSTFAMYREALRLRRELDAFGDGPMSWVDIDGLDPSVLVLRRQGTHDDVIAIVNTGASTARLPASIGREVLIASGDAIAELTSDSDEPVLVVGPDTAVWLRA